MDKVKKMEKVQEAMRNKFAMLNNPWEMSFLKKSLVPIPCQECMLAKDGHIISETVDWVLDLKDDLPIWSRLITMNTSAFARNMPLSQLDNYDIEVDKRLWSLWGNRRCTTMSICSECNPKKGYLGATVMALCAARIFNLNVWNSTLLDIILKCGKQYWQNSIQDMRCPANGFNLKHLDAKCNLEGIQFGVGMVKVSDGRLYGNPLDSGKNLAWCLIDFLRHHQFGILESNNRVLGFGGLRNRPGGYFMFDAQTKNYPLFPPDQYAPYILRTNHLQILLYCLVVAIKSPHPNINFTIYQVDIELEDPEDCLKVSQSLIDQYPSMLCSILPDEYFCTPSPSPRSSEQRISALMNDEIQLYPKPEPIIYRHPNKPNLIVKCVGGERVRPMVDYSLTSGKSIKLPCHDWMRIICSDTRIPRTEYEVERRLSKSFVGELNNILATGCAKRDPPHIPCKCDRWGPRIFEEPRLHPCSCNYFEMVKKQHEFEMEQKRLKLAEAQQRQQQQQQQQ